MVFSSSLFLFFFFPVFFIVFFFVPSKFKDGVIITASLLFYAWGANYFVLIMLATCVLDYKLGSLIYRIREDHGEKNTCKLYIFLDVLINVGILLYFKYANFFVDNINVLLSLFNSSGLTLAKVILPIGISFVVFQKMTYCLDIAAGTAKPADHFYTYIEYMLIFPALIAGPILKYNLLAPQFKSKEISLDNIEAGFKRFAIGLAKKVLIADTVAKYADLAFNGPASAIPVHYTWIGIVCYTLQIYFDFSAYSDMAIGMLKIMGLKIPENFNFPYISKSITEFWKRWHISLTSWMREYLYIPLGGNRKGSIRTYFNLWIVFLISGFWHGASWNFVIWGLWHGMFLVIERLKPTVPPPPPIKHIITLLIVMIGWVFFRADTLGHAFEYIKQMFNFSSFAVHTPPERIMFIDNFGIFIIYLAVFICIFPSFEKLYAGLIKIKDRFPRVILVFTFLLFLISAAKVGTASFSPFIYFRF